MLCHGINPISSREAYNVMYGFFSVVRQTVITDHRCDVLAKENTPIGPLSSIFNNTELFNLQAK